MSTLKVDTVQHNTSGFNNVVQFTDGAATQNGTLCRAWVNFNGEGTVATRADFNVNTITDSGTGQYTVNFTNAMVDGNYSALGTMQGGNAYILTTSSTNSNYCSIYTWTDASAFIDRAAVYIAIFR